MDYEVCHRLSCAGHALTTVSQLFGQLLIGCCCVLCAWRYAVPSVLPGCCEATASHLQLTPSARRTTSWPTPSTSCAVRPWLAGRCCGCGPLTPGARRSLRARPWAPGRPGAGEPALPCSCVGLPCTVQRASRLLAVSKPRAVCCGGMCLGLTHSVQVKVVTELEEQHAQLLQRLPQAMQAHHASRHRQAAAVPGASAAAAALASCGCRRRHRLDEHLPGAGSGRWSMPRLILDEHAYRQQARQQAD